ncbi:MAG: hypothetical protein R3253_01205, partial [Longimicrobiales bacterium]|nr:hypothetical protein [Longimicrobiales bacterium]
MDIRTKLIFTFVAVALASMAALAYTTYATVGVELRDTRIEQLRGLAEFKAQSIESIVESWGEQMSLVATRDRLRTDLAAYLESPDPAEMAQLQEVLRNVRRASPTFHQVAVHGPTGDRIAWAGPEPGHPAAELDLVERGDAERPWFIGVEIPEGGEMPLASMAAPIDLAGERVGYLHALLSMDEIIQISRNYEGLGESGETMVTAMDDGTPRVMHPVRAAPVPGDTAFDTRRFRRPGLPLD